MVPNYFLQNRIAGLIVSVALGVLAGLTARHYHGGWGLWPLCIISGLALFPILENLLWEVNPSRSKQAHLAARVRNECAPLFQRIHERKVARGSILRQPTSGMIVNASENLMSFVEATDIHEAIKAGIFTRSEESLLRYVRFNMGQFGQVTGKMDVVTHRYCQTVDYFAIRPAVAGV